jgi:hypothetical protein
MARRPVFSTWEYNLVHAEYSIAGPENAPGTLSAASILQRLGRDPFDRGLSSRRKKNSLLKQPLSWLHADGHFSQR